MISDTIHIWWFFFLKDLPLEKIKIDFFLEKCENQTEENCAYEQTCEESSDQLSRFPAIFRAQTVEVPVKTDLKKKNHI